MTIPEFPGLVASGGTPLECIEDLYGRLERWVRRSLEHGYHLPPLPSKDGVIDLNLPSNRALATYHEESKTPEGGDERIYIGRPDELEAFFAELDRNL
jgi:hypothetical protein